MKGAPYCNCTLNTPVYHRDIDGGALGMANNNGTIIVNPDIDPDQEEGVIEHEKVHLDQMERGDLKYDDIIMTLLLGKVKNIQEKLWTKETKPFHGKKRLTKHNDKVKN